MRPVLRTKGESSETEECRRSAAAGRKNVYECFTARFLICWLLKINRFPMPLTVDWSESFPGDSFNLSQE